MLILLYLFYLSKRQFGAETTGDVIFSRMILIITAFCFADIFAWGADGRTFSGSRQMISLANIVYISFEPIMCFAWTDFVISQIEGRRVLEGKYAKLNLVPLVLLILLIVSTPLTNFAFSIDGQNYYHRGVGAILSPVLSWFFLVFATARATVFAVRHKDSVEREKLRLIYEFLIPPLIATIIQLLWYGTSVLSIGFTLSLLVIFINRQRSQISLDELSGLNNRREMKKYFDRRLGGSNVTICVSICVIDIDRFKSINDRFGHLEGDEAIRTISNVLRAACGTAADGWFLARYGGDEFVIAGVNKTEDDFALLNEAIERELQRENADGDHEWKLNISVGCAAGLVRDYAGVENLLALADAKMYADKNRKR